MSTRRTKTLDVERLRQAGRTAWLAGLGAVATVEEETRDVFTSLVKEGKRIDARQRETVDRLVEGAAERAKEVRSTIEAGLRDAMSTALHGLGIPTHSDIELLTRRVEELTKKMQDARA